MTRSCFLGWLERYYTTDFSSQGSFHSVPQPALHHSKMRFTKWLHILACVCLGFSSHSNTLLGRTLCQLPKAGKLCTVSSRFTQSNPLSHCKACLGQTQELPMAVPDTQYYLELKRNQRAKLKLGTSLPVMPRRSCLYTSHVSKHDS